MAGIIRNKYGPDIDVLYPPVLTESPRISFDANGIGFVCIGRISPEKRIERIVEILKSVRLRGHNIHLHVIGGTDETTYGKAVEDLCRNQGGWVITEGGQFGEEGQGEIVRHESLMYDRVEDAVEKIDTILRKPQLMVELQEQLRRQGEKFSMDAFMGGLRAAVEKFLSASYRQKSF